MNRARTQRSRPPRTVTLRLISARNAALHGGTDKNEKNPELFPLCFRRMWEQRCYRRRQGGVCNDTQRHRRPDVASSSPTPHPTRSFTDARIVLLLPRLCYTSYVTPALLCYTTRVRVHAHARTRHTRGCEQDACVATAAFPSCGGVAATPDSCVQSSRCPAFLHAS